MSRIVYFIFFLFFNFALTSQMSMPDSYEGYEGYFNFAHPAHMELNFNGNECKGSYTLKSSQSNFMLSGYLKDGKWLLEEQDENGNTSAFLIAETDGKEVWGEWKNLKQDLFIPFRFSKTNIPSKTAWLKKLSGTLFNQNVEIFVQKYLNDDLSGYLLLSDSKTSLAFEGLCLKGNDQSLILYSTDVNNPYFTSIEIKTQQESTYDVKLLDTKGSVKFTTFKKSNDYSFGLNHFADYYNLYDISYPQLNNKIFDNWLADKITTWTKANQKHGKIQSVLNDGNHESLRFSNSMLGWVDLHYFSNNIISGSLNMQEIGNNTFKKESFLFDLRAKKLLSSDQIFSDFKAVQKLINTKGKQDLLNQKEIKGSAQLTSWIENETFNNMTFEHDHFVFSTEFDSVFGSQKIKLNLTDLKKYIKKSVYNRLSR